jgi:hypothetical protein
MYPPYLIIDMAREVLLAATALVALVSVSSLLWAIRR